METKRNIMSGANLTRFTDGVDVTVEEGNWKGKERIKGGVWSFSASGQRAGGGIVAKSLGSGPSCWVSSPRATR